MEPGSVIAASVSWSEGQLIESQTRRHVGFAFHISDNLHNANCLRPTGPLLILDFMARPDCPLCSAPVGGSFLDPKIASPGHFNSTERASGTAMTKSAEPT